MILNCFLWFLLFLSFPQFSPVLHGTQPSSPISQDGRGSGQFGSCQVFRRFRRFRRSVSGGSATQPVQVEYFDRPKIIVSKDQIVVPPENDVFDIFEGIGCQLRFQILNWMKRADPCFGVCRNSAWSPSCEKNILKIAKIWTTPSTGYY